MQRSLAPHSPSVAQVGPLLGSSGTSIHLFNHSDMQTVACSGMQQQRLHTVASGAARASLAAPGHLGLVGSGPRVRGLSLAASAPLRPSARSLQQLALCSVTSHPGEVRCGLRARLRIGEDKRLRLRAVPCALALPLRASSIMSGRRAARQQRPFTQGWWLRSTDTHRAASFALLQHTHHLPACLSSLSVFSCRSAAACGSRPQPWPSSAAAVAPPPCSGPSSRTSSR